MSKVVPLNHSAVRRRAPARADPTHIVGAAADALTQLKPSQPLYILWTERIAAAARDFAAGFPGTAMYAVKTNPHPEAIRAIYRAGVTSFDVASMQEIRLVRKVAPKARMYFMHPVKAPEAIREAYTVYGIRDFVLDCEEELYKILRETDLASDLRLYVRMGLPKNGKAAIDFSSKFGAGPEHAVKLLRQCRPVAEKLGLCFHVGTQITEPKVYAQAIDTAAKVIAKSGVSVDALDVGGGFPVPYPGQDAPALTTCFDTIKTALGKNGLAGLEILGEPGRALVAQGGSLVVRVELRKGQMLYLNDGTYGGLFDAGPLLNTRYPVRAYRDGGRFEDAIEAFQFAGPTCDSLDMMKGPFLLPADIDLGDWIEIGNLGAYSQGMRTNFNGFGGSETVFLFDSAEKTLKRKKK